MRTGRVGIGSLALLVAVWRLVSAADAELPPRDPRPILRVEPGGATAAVTALAFSPDGNTLFTGGLDKVVRVWGHKDGQWTLTNAFRVPLGPDNAGAINAIAVSPDGQWLAIGGRGLMRGDSGFRQDGVDTPVAALPEAYRLDLGMIYVAGTTNPAGGKVLRGHEGEIVGLAFAPAHPDKPPLLVSAGRERSAKAIAGSMRLWDVKTGTELARGNGLPGTLARVNVAVWHTGAAPRQLRVAFAWAAEGEAGALRLWDAENAGFSSWDKDAAGRLVAYNAGTAAAFFGQDRDGVRVVGAGYYKMSDSPRQYGEFHLWQLDGRRGEIVQSLRFEPDRDFDYQPRAIAPLAPQAGPFQRVAVVLRPDAPAGSSATTAPYELSVLDCSGGRPREVRRLVLPPADRAARPAAATSPDGRFFAIAGFADHSVRVYPAPDVHKKDVGAMAVLDSTGVTFRSVAFVNKGTGLWLAEAADAAPLKGGWHFDFDNRRLRPAADLTLDAPVLGDWEARFAPDGQRPGVRLFYKGEPRSRILLTDRDEITYFQPLPRGRDKAIVAIALREKDTGRVLIRLYRDDGVPFRDLAGHLQAVRGMAFSGTRPLLASVGEDQVVCIWSLTELDGASGRIAGLVIGDEDGKAVVRGVEPGSTATGKLVPGDVVEAVGPAGGELRVLKSAPEFYWAVHAQKPNDMVELRVAGKGKVVLAVSQGMDQRKPLFTLAVLKRDKEIDWVGYSPAGPYDASGEPAEARLGWHSNTGDAKKPVEYAPVGDYRKDYYRTQILKYLAAEADLGRALERWKKEIEGPPPEPNIRPTIVEARQGVLHAAPVTLVVFVNPDYRLDDKHVMKWRAWRRDGDNVIRTAAIATGVALPHSPRFSADLSGLWWRRGEYVIRAEFFANADAVQPIESKEVVIRFSPPAPTLALVFDGKDGDGSEAKPFKTEDEKIKVMARIGADEKHDVVIRFVHAVNGAELPAEPLEERVAPAMFERPVALQPGRHRLTMFVSNKGAAPGEETDSRTVWIEHKPRPDPLPKFAGVKIEPDGEWIERAGKRVLVVAGDTVKVTGQIEAANTLVEADFTAGASSGGTPVKLPLAGDPKTLAFAQTVKLEAGKQVELRVRARSKNSDLAEETYRVLFWPRLPNVVLTPPGKGDVYRPEVTLRGTVEAFGDHEYRVAIRVTPPRGAAKRVPVKVDPAKRTWEATLDLAHGDNQLDVLVSNEWRGEQKVDAASLWMRYRRPPVMLDPEPVKSIESAVVDVKLQVRTPKGMALLPPVIDDHQYFFTVIKREEKDGIETLDVLVKDVPVYVGDRKLDVLRVIVANDDGPAQEAKTIRVIHEMKPKPPAAVEILSPNPDTTEQPSYRVRYRVVSESDLKSVELRRGDEVLYRADLKKARRDGERFVLEEEAAILLQKGSNDVRLVALNAGGASAPAGTVISYKPPPVVVFVDQFEELVEGNVRRPPVKPKVNADGTLVFPDVTTSTIYLTGRVRWGDPRDARDLRLQLRVNDQAQELPIAWSKVDGEPNMRRFEVPVSLSKQKNRLVLELIDPKGAVVAQTADSRRVFHITSKLPPKPQRLHLLIVGVEITDEVLLKNRVLETLGAKTKPPSVPGVFTTNAFEHCVLHYVLTKDVDESSVLGQVDEINKEILRLKNVSGWQNDVVLIYYQGRDYTDKQGRRWLLTRRNLLLPDEPIENHAIAVHNLPMVQGVPLLLLNVSGKADTEGTGIGADSSVGMIRYAWLDRKDAKTVDADLLPLMGEALQKKSRLGDAAAYLKETLLRGKPVNAEARLTDDQRGREMRRETEP
jgi:WD40 repeat protein